LAAAEVVADLADLEAEVVAEEVRVAAGKEER
jgi:hypothetical protein